MSAADNTADNDDRLAPAVVEWLTDAVSAPPLPPARKEAVWSRILQRIHAPGPAGTLTVRASEGEWIACLPGVDVRILYVDEAQNTQTALWRMQPGSVLPAHAHAVNEECLVLEGAIRSGDFVVRQGDYHLGFAGQPHPDIHSDGGALLLIRSERKYLRSAHP